VLAKMADSPIQVSNEIYNTVGVANKKQKNKVFACAEHNKKSCLKLVEFVELVKPLSVGRVILSCGGSKNMKAIPYTKE